MEFSGVKTMGLYTKDEILQMAAEEDVEFIRLQFSDMFGNLKNTAVTCSQLKKVLNNEFSFDGSAVNGFFRTEDTELYLWPDLDSFVILPWRPQQGKVARMLCDVRTASGEPFIYCSRSILKRVLKDLESEDLHIKVGAECEFFLFQTDEDGNPTTRTAERAGYFDIGPIDQGENARRDMVLTLEQMGFVVESSYHEKAPGQHEIDFHWDEALHSADSVMTFKFAVRTIARRHGLHATFMPKPKTGEPGSGMHLNFAVFDGQGNNIFHDPEDPLKFSRKAFCFAGGILAHADAISAITNPLVNSYKRLVPGYDAPVCKSWSASGSNAMMRLHTDHTGNAQIELRSPDSASNPYLALAVCIAAGLDGIRKSTDPGKELQDDSEAICGAASEGSGIAQLPTTLGEAISFLEKDSFVKELLGESFVRQYINTKKEDWKEYMPQVTEWEIEKYLYRI